MIPLRGTKDILPSEYDAFENVINIARNVAHLCNFKPIATPIIENSEVFLRSIGEESDIVSKEIYQFKGKANKNGKADDIALRPEFTAGIVRAFISNGLKQDVPLKLFSHGPLFRYERPQKGRQRQFHQINFEHIGMRKPIADAEAILAAYSIIKQLGIDLSKLSLHINSLGDNKTRASYAEEICKILTPKQAELSEDSKRRLEKNPLRILDSKEACDKNLIQAIPPITEFLSDESKAYFEQVKNLIQQNSDIKIVEDKNLVRGLDYYTDTVFEFVSESDEMGAQATLIAGGRYDNLINQMGGGDVPAFGFAGGVERLMMLSSNYVKKRQIDVAILPDFSKGKEDEGKLLKFLNFLRGQGCSAEVIFGKNFGKNLKKAEQLGTKLALIINEESEVNSSNHSIRVKNLSHKLIVEKELTTSLNEIVAILKN